LLVGATGFEPVTSPCQIPRASAGLYSGGLETGKDRWKAACERRCQRPAASTICHGSPRVVLIPTAVSCCPSAARRAKPARRVSDLRFLRTVGDRWCAPMPELDRCDTDPARTGRLVPSGRGRLLVLRSSATRDRSAGRARKANPRPGAPRAWKHCRPAKVVLVPSRMVSQSRHGRCQG
jgi:hypothetical protein